MVRSRVGDWNIERKNGEIFIFLRIGIFSQGFVGPFQLLCRISQELQNPQFSLEQTSGTKKTQELPKNRYSNHCPMSADEIVSKAIKAQ